jgi:hypothetical protein
MKRVMDYQTHLAALKRWFHQGQTPGEYYKPEAGISFAWRARRPARCQRQ